MITVVHLESWKEGNQTRFSKKKARELLNIHRRDRFNQHCKALGLFSQRSYTYEELAEILALDLYLKASYGKHSRSQYVKLKKQPRLLALRFQQLGISLENELGKILNHDHSATAI